MGPEEHPLRSILGSHLRELSERQWGYPDFTWVVTKGGSHKSPGSPVWRNICIAWAQLKPLLMPSSPRNMDKWQHLPLWRPHKNHISPRAVRCKTLAQHRIRDRGFFSMADITIAPGEFIPWNTISPDTPDRLGLRAFEALKGNLQAPPDFQELDETQNLFFENS